MDTDILPATIMALGVGTPLLVSNLRKVGRGIFCVEFISFKSCLESGLCDDNHCIMIM